MFFWDVVSLLHHLFYLLYKIKIDLYKVSGLNEILGWIVWITENYLNKS